MGKNQKYLDTLLSKKKLKEGGPRCTWVLGRREVERVRLVTSPRLKMGTTAAAMVGYICRSKGGQCSQTTLHQTQSRFPFKNRQTNNPDLLSRHDCEFIVWLHHAKNSFINGWDKGMKTSVSVFRPKKKFWAWIKFFFVTSNLNQNQILPIP